jgi:DNA-binding NtrC family response regulator
VAALSTGSEELAALGDMIGKSRLMVQVSKEIALASESDASVLITGESGTGKELVARAIHAHSGRCGLFLAVNCAAIVDTLLESELFGHEKGAFTGAVARKAGRFELAGDGTLFLDEIGELVPRLQAKLLRVLQERTFERLGGTQTLMTNARIVAATNRDIKQEADAGRFREDLLYRLDVIHIHVPPLRERREDIPLLVEGLLARIATAVHKPRISVTDDAVAQLAAYAWPGNVRELENVLTQAVVRARGSILDRDSMRLPRDAAPAASNGAVQASLELQTLGAVEAAHVRRVLEHTHGHKGKACAILGISRPALDRKIRKYGLTV